jgi:hypothetical protein
MESYMKFLNKVLFSTFTTMMRRWVLSFLMVGSTCGYQNGDLGQPKTSSSAEGVIKNRLSRYPLLYRSALLMSFHNRISLSQVFETYRLGSRWFAHCTARNCNRPPMVKLFFSTAPSDKHIKRHFGNLIGPLAESRTWSKPAEMRDDSQRYGVSTIRA